MPYESLDEFDKLKTNPPFPDVVNDELENEIARGKRGVFNAFKKTSNKMDQTIRDTPEEFPPNSKFTGFNILNDFGEDSK